MCFIFYFVAVSKNIYKLELFRTSKCLVCNICVIFLEWEIFISRFKVPPTGTARIALILYCVNLAKP